MHIYIFNMITFLILKAFLAISMSYIRQTKCVTMRMSVTQSYSSCIQIHHGLKPPIKTDQTLTVTSQYKIRKG